MVQKKLSLAIIQQSPDIGGAEIFMLSLITEFEKQGHSVLVSTNKGKFYTELKKCNISVTSNPVVLDIIGNYKGLIKSIVFLPKAIRYYVVLLKRLKKQRVDVILMSGFSEKMLVTFLSVFFSIPVVWIEYGPLQDILKRNFYIPKILYRALSKITRKVIVPTLNTQKSLINSGCVPITKLEIIPCGIYISKNIKKKSFKGWENNTIIGCISRLVDEKGQKYILDAIPNIIKSMPTARFLFVGDGPAKEEYEELSRKLHIEKYVLFTGFVENANDFYAYIDVFVFPSTWPLEGFGLVMVEAMAHKVPVVANDFGPVSEIINDSVGIKVNIKNKKDFTHAIVSLSRDKQLQRDLGEEGRLQAEKKFDIKNVANSYEKVLYDAS